MGFVALSGAHPFKNEGISLWLHVDRKTCHNPIGERVGVSHSEQANGGFHGVQKLCTLGGLERYKLLIQRPA